MKMLAILRHAKAAMDLPGGNDFDRPLEEQGGAIVRVHAGPDLRMHLQPTSGRPRPVGEAKLPPCR